MVETGHNHPFNWVGNQPQLRIRLTLYGYMVETGHNHPFSRVGTQPQLRIHTVPI